MQSPELGDYVGAESYVDFVMDFTTLTPAEHNGGGGRRRKVMEKDKKEYPPPISPWVMKKYSTGDGRLIIQEEKVRFREYFQAHKANGRLLLNLVTFDIDASEHAEDEEGMDELREFDGEENVNEQVGGLIEDQDVVKKVEVDDPTVENESIISGGGAKCSEYNSMGKVSVAAFEPVLT